MKTVTCICYHCKSGFQIVTGAFNRAMKTGRNVYCGRRCAGMARRLENPPTPDERKALKAAYDAEYRAKNREMLKAKKAAYFQKTYNKVEAARVRKMNMHKHVEYCRQPEYRAWKAGYDKLYRAKKEFGDFAEAAVLLNSLEAEVLKRASRYDISLTNGTLNKAQKRKRAL